jgi:hypothetical protein
MTVAQWPNVSLWAFIVLAVALHVFSPKGGTEHVLRVVADVALLVWAVDEVVRGVNPFRRILGVVVFAATIVSLML